MRRTPLLAAALSLVALLGAPARAASTDVTLGGVPCELIGVPTAAPVGTGSCPGVRPGAVVESELGFCSLSFLFRGSDGGRYIGTAGHCILEAPITSGDAGERAWPEGSGPSAFDGDGERFGEFAYAVLSDPRDFALIRIDEGVVSDPQMCHFGGPTGTNSDTPGLFEPVVLHQHGNGLAVGSVVPARTMVAAGMPDPDHVFAEGVVVPGDSGSGVISADGRAVGVAVTAGLHASSIGTTGLDVGTVGITRLAPQVAQAEQVLGISLDLLTAPTL